MTLSHEFVRLHKSLTYDALSGAAIEAAKARCMDYLGALAGGINGPLARPMLRAQAAAPCSPPESSVLATPLRAPCATAALLNGITGHTLELDDGDRRSYGHPGVVVLSALFPVAEALRASGKDFLLAMTIGYEAYVRIGQAANPGMLRRGYHSTGTAGALAAALAVSSVRGFDTDAMLGALGIAGLCASGLCISLRKACELKPFSAGRAAYNGVVAAEMVALGLAGADDILEGKDGFFQAYSGQEADPAVLLAPLGSPFAVEGSYIKFYPACRYTHAPIDAALALRDKVVLDDVEKIIITTYPTAISLTAKDTLPADAASTRFNMGFGVALALAQGKVSMSDFCAEKAADPLIATMFSKIRYQEDPALDSIKNNVRGAEMEIICKDGTRASIRVPLPVGEPENPAPAERYRQKFMDLSRDVWSGPRQRAILERIAHLEELEHVTELTDLLRPDRQ